MAMAFRLPGPLTEVSFGDGYYALPLNLPALLRGQSPWMELGVLGPLACYAPKRAPVVKTREALRAFFSAALAQPGRVIGLHCHGSPQALKATFRDGRSPQAVPIIALPEVFTPLLTSTHPPAAVILFACETAGRPKGGGPNLAEALSALLGEVPVFAAAWPIHGRCGFFHQHRHGRREGRPLLLHPFSHLA
jgi:hypothetical protein